MYGKRQMHKTISSFTHAISIEIVFGRLIIKMKRKAVQFKIERPAMSEGDFRLMLEGVMTHRENLVRYGTPFAPEKPDSELVEQRKHDLDAEIAECRAKIEELEDTKERYHQLLRVIYEEESRIKEEQRAKYNGRAEMNNEPYMQRPM